MSEKHRDNAKLAVMRQDGYLLLLRRSEFEDSRVGQWDFIGGKLEPEELPIDTVLREGPEEAGLQLDVNRMRFLGVYDKTRPTYCQAPVFPDTLSRSGGAGRRLAA